MVSVRSLLVAALLCLASVARAESDGVPFVDGDWTGKIKAVYYDQTNEGSNRPKHHYRDKVDVVIDQDAGEIEFDVTFDEGLPTSSGTTIVNAVLEGFVGNYHLSIAQFEEQPLLVASGQVTKNGKKMKIRGTAATADYTIEFQIQLKKRNN